MDRLMTYRTVMFTILLACMNVTVSFGQSPDLQQLKVKLQQLEKMMEDLKQQIAIAEASESTPVAPTPPKASPPSCRHLIEVISSSKVPREAGRRRSARR
jgi:hypothetical protein